MVEPTLKERAEAALALKKKYEDEKILFYKPCCRVHSKWVEGKMVNECKEIPCRQSVHGRFHLSYQRIRIVFGGNRSSKTTTALVDFLMSACYEVHPFRLTKATRIGGRYRIYAPDFSLLEKVMIPKVKEWIPRSALRVDGKNKEEAWENSYDSRNHILKLKRKGTIDFMSYDQDLSKSESDELDGVLADEEMPEEVYNAVQARLISRRGFFIMAVTPLYKLSWAMRFLDDVSPQVKTFRWEIYDNPHNHPEAVKEFEDSIKNPLEKEARLKGLFMEFKGIVYKELRPEIHLIGQSSANHNSPIVFALDPHPRKPSVMVWAYLTPKNDLVVFDELEFHGNAQEIVRMIRRKESDHPAPTLLRLIDPAAKAQGSDIAYETDTLREFEREGMSFSLADNSEAGYNIVHQYLAFDTSKPIGNLNRPQLYFTKEVPLTWFGMTHLMWDDWNSRRSMRDEKERIKDFKKDFPDCVRYISAMRPTCQNLLSMNAKPIGNYIEMEQFKRKQDVRDVFLKNREVVEHELAHR